MNGCTKLVSKETSFWKLLFPSSSNRRYERGEEGSREERGERGLREQSEAEKWFFLLVCSSSCEDKKKDSVGSSKGTAKGKGGKVEKSLVGEVPGGR